MKPNTRLSMGLIFGLLVVGVALILRAGWIKGSDVNLTPTITPRPQFINAAADSISQIQVVDVESGDRFVARRGPDQKWQIVQAKEGVETKYGVDETRIENVVSVLVSISANRTLSQIEALAQYGLDKPTHQIVVTDTHGDTTITVGGTNPDKSSYYTQKSGSQDVYLISTYNLDELIDFLANPPYLAATPNPDATLPDIVGETETPSGSATAAPTVFINVTVQFTPRATETPTPTKTFTPTATKTPGPSPTPTPK